eukprot:808444-Amorphochlora_amoeboformis.AAC.1
MPRSPTLMPSSYQNPPTLPPNNPNLSLRATKQPLPRSTIPRSWGPRLRGGFLEEMARARGWRALRGRRGVKLSTMTSGTPRIQRQSRRKTEAEDVGNRGSGEGEGGEEMGRGGMDNMLGLEDDGEDIYRSYKLNILH